jgi:ABC-type xylose transport system substrate-binding protein
MTKLYFLLLILLIDLKGHSLSLLVDSNNKTKIGLLLADLTVERWKSDREFFILTARNQGYDVLVAEIGRASCRERVSMFV